MRQSVLGTRNDAELLNSLLSLEEVQQRSSEEQTSVIDTMILRDDLPSPPPHGLPYG